MIIFGGHTLIFRDKNYAIGSLWSKKLSWSLTALLIVGMLLGCNLTGGTQDSDPTELEPTADVGIVQASNTPQDVQEALDILNTQTAQADGSLLKLLKGLARTALLIIDDLGLEVATSKQYRDLLEVIDDRVGQGATLITSQFPVKQWHDLIPDATVADALLDRLVHHAYRLDLKGKSMRDPEANPSDK